MPHNQMSLKPVLKHIASPCWSRISNNLLWQISNTSSLREIKINRHYAPLTTLTVTTWRLHENTLLEKCMGIGEMNYLFKMSKPLYIDKALWWFAWRNTQQKNHTAEFKNIITCNRFKAPETIKYRCLLKFGTCTVEVGQHGTYQRSQGMASRR